MGIKTRNAKSFRERVFDFFFVTPVNADGDIFIEGNVRISGHVFSQQSIYISAQTIIGCPQKIKSIIGKKAVRIEKYVSIYGYVSTEGNGIVI